MDSIHWGALLVASWPVLSAGCAGSPAPEPILPPAPSASPPPVEAPAPEVAPVNVGPAVAEPSASPAARLPGDDVLARGEPVLSVRAAWSALEQRVSYGRGALTLRRFSTRSAAPGCPLMGSPPGCALFALTAPAPLPEAGPWWGGSLELRPEPPAAPGFHSAAHRWDALVGGRDAIYALAADAGAIERIDEQGRVTTFVQGDLKQWASLHVFDQGEHFFVIGHSNHQPMVLTEALPASEPGEARKLAEPVNLPMRLVEGDSARAAREATYPVKMAMAGEPRFVSLPHEGKDRWAMVWLEIVPPAYGPHSAPRAKHGCGRASHGPSRPLRDPSIEKKAHVTRFDGKTLVDDTVAWSKAELDPWSVHLEVRGEGEQLAVSAIPDARGATPRELSASAMRGVTPLEQLDLTSDEELVEASFDHGSREGLIVVWSGGRLHHRRFDAEGKFQGEAATYPFELPRVTLGEISLRRVAGRWYGLHRDTVLPLSDGTASVKPLPEAHDFVALAEDKGQPLLLSNSNDTLFATTLDAQGRRVGPSRRVAAFPKFHRPSMGEALWQAPGEPPWLGVVEQEHSDSPSLRVVWLPVRPGAKWSTAMEIPYVYTEPRKVSFREVPGDMVAMIEGGPVVLSAWLRGGKTSQTPVAPGKPETKPLLLPPASAGSLGLEAGLAGAERECPRVLSTGAATLLACASGVEASKPGVKVSLRRVVSAAK